MTTNIQRKNCSFQFSLIWLKGIDYRLFLKRDAPAEIMLGILADFGKRNKETAVQEIFQKVTARAETSLDQERFWAQLRVLADLRSLWSHN